MSYFDDSKYYDSDNDDDKKKINVDDDIDADPDVDVDIDDDDDDDDDTSNIIEEEEEEKEIGDDEDIENIDKKLEESKSNPTKKITKELPLKTYNYNGDDDDDDDDNDESYLQKFDKDINENYLVNFHPECVHQNYDEVLALSNVIRNKDHIIIDDLHRTIPYLTKYERARILGQRAKQINSGATPFVKVSENVIDGYLIAELELKAKRIPFIIRRPLPNGGSEYWKVNDLEDIIY